LFTIFNSRSNENQTALQHAIKRHLPVVADVLCQRGVDMNTTGDNGDCPLWQSLDSGQEDIAQTLVSKQPLLLLCSLQII